MEKRPSIKGRVFGPALEDVQKLLADGQLTAKELGRWLKPEAPSDSGPGQGAIVTLAQRTAPSTPSATVTRSS